MISRTSKRFDPASLNFHRCTLSPAKFTPPTRPHQPCVWIVALGPLQENHHHLLAHYQTQATHAGYEFGLIAVGNDGATAGRLLQGEARKGWLLLVNAGAPDALVKELLAWVPDRAGLQALSTGGAVDADDPMAWDALAEVEARPIANHGPTPWTVAQLEGALSALNRRGPMGATPPRGSRVPDDLDLSHQHHEDVDAAIQQMKQAGLLDAPSADLALKLRLFANGLEMRRTARVVDVYRREGAPF